MIQALSDYYRVPEGSLGHVFSSDSQGDVGFFRFGPGAICYGRCATRTSRRVENSGRYDCFGNVDLSGSAIYLPFDPAQVIDNLRRERYVEILVPEREKILTREWMLKFYYFVREYLPVSVRRHLQRAYFSDWKSLPFPAWPVDFTVDTLHERFLRLSMQKAGLKRIPFIWFWPEGAPNCVILTHDVETSVGRGFTAQLMDIDDSYGFKASFQVIPEKRYEVSDEYVHAIRDRGFEFNIHDLNHDGHLYRKREEFLCRAKRINRYSRQYNARGFRAGAMYRNPDWYEAFEFYYDMSLPNVAHLEPKRGGCCTVFPFFLGKILELPLTTSQDYSVFHILKDYSIDLWKTQLNLIGQRNGLISFLAHPDYLGSRRPRQVYESLLAYLRQLIDHEKTWSALPREVDQWWRARSQMKLVQNNNQWEIKGPGAERARLAYAVLNGDGLVYEVDGLPAREEKHPLFSLSFPTKVS